VALNAVIARGVFSSVVDLSRKLIKYVTYVRQSSVAIRWTYADTKRRMTAKDVAGTGQLVALTTDSEEQRQHATFGCRSIFQTRLSSFERY
jgi:hypothetical protein